VQTLPLSYGVTLLPFVDKELLGAFGGSIRLEFTTVFSILLILLGYNVLKKSAFKLRNNIWLAIFILFCIVSVFNPANAFRLSSLVPLSFVIQMIFLIKVIHSNFTREEIFVGIYDGLKFTTLLQFCLCIFYPVLGMQEFAGFFKSGVAAQWADRRAGYSSAVGTFAHPAQLALFSFLTLLFFFGCALNHFRRRQAYYFMSLNTLIIFLTFSRTTYVVLLTVLVIVYITFNSKAGLFTARNLFKFLSISILILSVLYFSPLSDLFLKSDSETQVENRMVHWVLGFEIWQTSKWIGLGLNSHVYYLGHKFLTDPFGGTIFLDFFVSNPIHNIHLIIFCELGLLGFLIWIHYYASNLIYFSKRVRTGGLIDNVFNLVFVGILFSMFIYGAFGWAPFEQSISGLCIFLASMALRSTPNNFIQEKFKQ
jgi:O-antigen ligase